MIIAERARVIYAIRWKKYFFITLVAALCGCDLWEGIDMFGKTKRSWLQQYFPYHKRTPSADTLIHFFAKLDSASFGHCFISWVNQLLSTMDNEVINIDGKRLCGFLRYLPKPPCPSCGFGLCHQQ